MLDNISDFVWKVEYANEIVGSDKVKKVKYLGTQPTTNTNNMVHVYEILTKDDEQKLLYTNDMITVDESKIDGEAEEYYIPPRSYVCKNSDGEEYYVPHRSYTVTKGFGCKKNRNSSLPF